MPDVSAENHGPFRALLAAAVHHEDAATGLAQAYVGLPANERARLLDAIVADARDEGIDVAAVLGPLYVLERDAALSSQMRAHLMTAGVRLERGPQPFRILLSGDPAQGAAVLVRPCVPSGLDVLTLSWTASDGVQNVKRQSLHDESELLVVQQQTTTGLPFEPSPLGFAAEVIATALWQHRRRYGTLPEALLDFADLLGPHALGFGSSD